MKYSDLKNIIRKKRKRFSDCITPLAIKLGGLAKYWGSHCFVLFLQPSRLFCLNHLLKTVSVNTMALATCSCDVLYLNWVRVFVTSSSIIIVTEADTGRKCFPCKLS